VGVQGRVSSHTVTVVLIAASWLVAVVVDYFAPWPFVMTPLYAVPVLVAAHRLPPLGVALTLAGAVANNLASGLLQGTPLAITLFYSFGLVAVGYLGARLATERRRAAALARESEQHALAAEQAQRRLQEFLGMVSHDQMQPLATLLLSTELLQRRFEPGRPDEAREIVDDIESAAHRVRRLTRDLMDAARIGAGHFEVHPVEGDLVPVLREIVDLKQRTTAEHELVLEAPERLDGLWDRERLGQLAANLVSNAIEHAPHGRVFVRLREDGGEALLSVSDEGPGIPPGRIGELFLPFARLDDGPHEGRGLGLYIVKAIAEEHGGRAWIESAPGRGSTFRVALPIAAGPRAQSVSRAIRAG
jgi:two-component system sensor histidine kinase VicK